MRESDEVNSFNGSYSLSRAPALSVSEQRLSDDPEALTNSSYTESHRFNVDHARVIPSLHTTIPSGYKYLQVHTLTKETVTLAVHGKCRVQDAYLCCCAHLGFDEERLFGLALRTPSEGIGGDRPRNEYFFLDPNRKITKYAPKQWKISHAWNTVVESRPFLALHLRVRIYVDKIQMIRCTPALRHYYLQLRENLLDQWSGSNSVAEERCWELAALALHADENGNDLLSFRAEQYFPLWVVNIHGLDFVRRNMPAVRKDLRACSNQDAVIEYCQQASRSPFALNCHLYGLRRHKMDTFDNAVIGIGPKGIELSDVGSDGERIPLRSLQWSRIAKLSFDKRKVTISGMDGVSLSLYAQFENKARYLLEFCKAFHQATMFINNQLTTRQNCSSSVTSPLFSGDERCLDDALSLRRSLNSHASSNSTSGVVSDKLESEADKDCEWTDTCGVASDCSCDETQPYTVEHLSGEVDRASLHAVTEVGGARDEETDTVCSAVVGNHSNTSSRSKEITSSEKSLETEEKAYFAASACNAALGVEYATEMQEVECKEEEAGSASSISEDVLTKESFTDSIANSNTNSVRTCNAQAKVDCSTQKDDFEKTDEGTETIELMMDTVLKKPPVYKEPLAFQAQQKLEVPYHRPNPNQNIKPRWITVAGVGPTKDTDSCPLETSVHLTHSEPKLHYQIYARSGSPLTALPTTSYQLPAVDSARPSLSYVPPVVQTGANGGLFQKRHGQRLPHATAVRGISRVQSMPAHNSQQYLANEELSTHCLMASSIKHSQSSPGTRFPVYAKQPPPYEHAVLQQARVRYAQKAASIVSKDTLSQRHSYTSEQEEMTLNSRIRQYPMMRALWQEHQQGSCGQLATSSSGSSAAQIGVPSVSNPMLSSLSAIVDRDSPEARLQRPSSCQELSSSMLVASPPHSAPITYSSPTACASRPSGRPPVYHRELYIPELSPPLCCYYSPYAAGQNQIRAGRPARDNEKTQKCGYSCPLIAVSEERMLF